MSYIAINIKNIKESEFVQKILFKMGYRWACGSTEVSHSYSEPTNFLYMDLSDNTICRSNEYDDDEVIENLNFEEFITKIESEVL